MIAPTPSPAARRAFLLPLVAFAVILGGSFALFSGCGLQTSGIPTNSPDSGSACTSDAQCDDGNPCTTDKCSADGECDSTPVADGPAPGAQQKQGTCKQIVCKAGESTTVADPSNAPKSTDPCMIAKCNGETPEVTAAPDGTSCDLNGAPSMCNKGKCAPPCTMSSQCPSMGACQTATCNGATGLCEYTNVPDGTPTPGVTQVAGDCNQRICLMGKDTNSPDGSDVPMVPAAMAGCADAKCNNGTPEFPTHPTDSQCSTFMGSMPGFCSATGECSQCTQDSECAGTSPSNDCEHPACQNNACKPAFTAANTPTTSTPAQTPGDCQEVVCDGSGMTKTIANASDAPSDPTGCNPWSCNGTTPVQSHDAPGTGCGGGLSCNAAGMCSGCTQDSQCQMGGTKPNAKCNAPNCACTPSTCASLGLSCGSGISDGCGGMLNCNDGKIDGNETAIDCGGNTNSCSTRCAQGLACKVNSDCQSNVCADGVCCDKACGGSCEACTAALKGQGNDGVCGAVASGKTDPRGQCQSQPQSSCGQEGGTCNGSGACTTWPTGTVCAAASCSGNTLVKQETCVGGLCTPGSPSMVSCSPYKCSGGACTTSCSVDTDCFNSGFYCGGGQCLAKLNQGTACTIADQCLSGFCANGFCCNAGCGGQCQACSAALTGGTNGTCANVKTGTADPSGSCTDMGSTSCKTDGKCTSTGMCEQYMSGTPCSTASCSNGMAMAGGTCNGTGTCSGGAMTSCSPYVCNSGNTACLTSCGSDSDCVNGDYCNGSTCAPRVANGGSCGSNDACTSGVCGSNGVCCTGSCPDQGASTCGTDGQCASGTGACQKYPAGTPGCTGTASCSGSTLTSPNQCNGSGQCTQGSSTAPCPGNLKCSGGSACYSSCSNDTQCVSGTFCDAGTCVAPQAAGAGCTANNQCSSALCKGGFCCQSACDNTGACVATSCDSGTGACHGPAGNNCGKGSCSGGNTETGLSFCNGAGVCTAAASYMCSIGCSGGGNSTGCSGCSVDGDCPFGYCNFGTCTGQQQSGALCTGNDQCLSGTCTVGTCQ